MTNNGKLSLAVFLTAIITGCAQSTPKPTESLESEQAVTSPESSVETESSANKGSFQASTLYSLLVAEFANQRGLPRVTLNKYIQEARKTQDIGVIQRAAHLAGQLKDREALLEIALIWVNAEPDNPVPLSLAAKELIRKGDAAQAAPLLEKSLTLNSLEVIDTVASRGKSMTTQERQTYLLLFDDLLKKTPESPYLLYAKASLLTHDAEYEQALALTQQALVNDPSYDRAVLLEADLQAHLGHLDTAIGHLREQLGEKDHKQFRTLYTRLLLEKNQYREAEKQADILTSSYSQDENLLYHLGVLMLEHERLDASEKILDQLSELIGFNGALHYLQGRIAQLRGNQQQALEYFINVDDSRYYISSFQEIGNILNRAEDQAQLAELFQRARINTPDYAPWLYGMESNWLIDHELDKAALALLNQALTEHPKDIRLLYTRGMLWERFDDLPNMEADFKALLKEQPDNATALNALGYTLTDRTERHEEAFQLIEKALKLKPEDPAILDSMGWVLHNLGDFQGALPHLKKAYALFPDPEVAAHLGTVHWKLGQKEQAMQIWNNALKEHPDHQLLNKSRALADQTK